MNHTYPGPVRPESPTQFTHGGVSRVIGGAASFFRRHLWLWPLILAVGLGAIAVGVQKSLSRTIKQQMANDLQNILKADVEALELWLKSRVGEAKAFGLDPTINRMARGLLVKTDRLEKFVADDVRAELKELREFMKARIDALDYPDFFIVDAKFRVVASMTDEAVGRKLSEYRLEFFGDILKGEAKTSVPYPSFLQLQDEAGRRRPGLPTMLTAAPMRDEQERIYAALAFRIRPDQEFSKILSLARHGLTGDTYAFNRDGLMLSESRYDDELRRIGLLPDHPDARSTLTVKLRDPGVNLIAAGPTAQPGAESRPLTFMAQQCIDKVDCEGRPAGYNVDGYRDYRGVPVIGAWVWLKEFDFGVATETEKSEAFHSLRTLELIFWGLFALLLACGVVMLVLMIVLDRRQAALRKAVLEMKRLGQYHLDEKLGQGGMGSVYRAHHDLMRRPTAVKLIDADRISPLAIARFEREVQHTSRLTHPNTIAIYDYGRTPEGIFYYAMEFLDGLDLDGLVDRFGAQPEGRVLFLLLQICGSLSEAHREGLIHRDIKPANVMLTERGGCADFVKVLDFGLVKSATEDEKATPAGGFTGTPMYLAPEGIESSNRIDHRTDLYAVGAVGYFLLTGSPPFQGRSVVEICVSATKDPVESPSARLGKPVSPDLEATLLKCLQKNPNSRFQSIDELAEALASCRSNGTWTAKMAKEWWEAWRSLRDLKQTSRKAMEALNVPVPVAAAATNWS
jgi:hypothetical protein